jgi:hypothetical protein
VRSCNRSPVDLRNASRPAGSHNNKPPTSSTSDWLVREIDSGRTTFPPNLIAQVSAFRALPTTSMLSIQIPQFAVHSRPNLYHMSDPSGPQGIPPLQKMSSHDHFSSGSESRTKASTPGAKRRPSRAGTRSVSTLTAAQLERKRANDREAQRAIRQRTKDHIDQLERRIAELSATNDTSAKLMHALQRNEELEQENALLRSRLTHAVAAMSDGGM